MEIHILNGKEGAKSARGLAVVIDVFRAFSVEAYFLAQGAVQVIALGDLNEAYNLQKQHPEYIYCGERHGIKCDGFDYGNSPSSFDGVDFTGKTIVHTTSAGTQGLLLAQKATEVLPGALVNAKAIATYIEQKNPHEVSLVAMGWEGTKVTEEDVLCAKYIESLLRHQPLKDINEQADALRYKEGKKFFDPAQQEVFPQADFPKCIAHDIFPFVIQTTKKGSLFVNRRYEVY